MSGADRQRELATGWLQLPVAVLLLAAFSAAPFVGALLAVGVAQCWRPPGVGWRPLPALRVVGCYLAFAALWLPFAVGYLRVVAIEPQPLMQRLAAEGAAMVDFWPWVITAVVLAPVVEEVVFRGYLFTALRLALPAWAAHLLTASAFGLVHGVGHALPIGALSLLFGHLRARYRSLLPSMCAHALHNALTVAAVVAWPDLLDLFYDR